MSTPAISCRSGVPKDQSKHETRMKRRGLTQGKKDEFIKDMLDQHLGVVEISRTFGVTRQTIQNAIRRLKQKGWVRTHNAKMHTFKVDGAEARRLVDSGVSVEIIASQLGMGIGQLRVWLKRTGWIPPHLRRRAQVKSLLQQGHYPKEVARILGIPHSLVIADSQALVKAGEIDRFRTRAKGTDLIERRKEVETLIRDGQSIAEAAKSLKTTIATIHNDRRALVRDGRLPPLGPRAESIKQAKSKIKTGEQVKRPWEEWLLLTPQTKLAKVRAVMDKGMTTTKAAKKLGISRQTLNGVLQQLKALGWRRANSVSADEVLRLAEQGLSTKEIAVELKISKQLVAVRLKETGWKHPCHERVSRLNELVKSLLKQEFSIKEISVCLGVPYSHALRAKNTLIKSEPEGTYPAKFYRKRTGAGRKPRKQVRPAQ